MYIVLEYTVYVLLTFVVATCLFGLCVVFILLQEGYRQLRCLIDRNMNSFQASPLKTVMRRLAPAIWNERPVTRNISNHAT